MFDFLTSINRSDKREQNDNKKLLTKFINIWFKAVDEITNDFFQNAKIIEKITSASTDEFRVELNDLHYITYDENINFKKNNKFIKTQGLIYNFLIKNNIIKADSEKHNLFEELLILN